MSNAPELGALNQSDDTLIADGNSKTKQIIAMVLFVVVGFFAIVMIFATSKEAPKNPLSGDEAFETIVFRPPSFLRETEELPKEVPETSTLILKLPPPPVVEEGIVITSSEFSVPPPPSIATLAPPEQIAAVEAEFPERWKSSSLLLDASSTGSQVGAAGQNAEAAGAPVVAGQDKSSNFLSAVTSIQDRGTKASKIERLDAFIPEGTLIPGILETAINSDLPGQVRAIVSKDVYSFDGRRVLVPVGTRLIGEYDSGIDTGQNRIFVVWSRLIRDDGVNIRLNSIGADSLGRSGVTGFVDKKFTERFGSAMLLSVVGGVSSYLTSLGSEAAPSATGTSNVDAENAEKIARETLAQTFSDMANEALKDGLKIPPSIYVDQGERIFVYVRQDLDFSALYKSPIEEEIDKIKRERGIKG